jgi:hypothetical protein
MKKATLIGLMMALAVTAFTQEREYQTLVQPGQARISGMGGPFMQFTSIGGDFAHMMGGGGAILVGDFWFGGYGLGLTNHIYADKLRSLPDYTTEDRLSASHGGFWIGYSLFGERPVHVAISSLIGWGQVGVIRDYYTAYQDGVFVMSPTVEVELNLTRFFRLGVGASYNLYAFVHDGNIPGYDWTDFSSPGGFLSFKFGWF